MTTAPLPPAIPEHVAELIIVGGTFDPPHLAHTKLPVEARAAAALDSSWLLFIPAARSPLKDLSPRASDNDRLAMLELAIEAIPQSSIWDDELARSRLSHAPSYTIDTLHRLLQCIAKPPARPPKLRLLLGTDQALAFHRWREPREILKLAPPLVMLRGTDASPFLEALKQTSFWTERELQIWANSIVSISRSDISSTRVRSLLEAGSEAASAELASCIAPAVLHYIQTRGLYHR